MFSAIYSRAWCGQSFWALETDYWSLNRFYFIEFHHRTMTLDSHSCCCCCGRHNRPFNFFSVFALLLLRMPIHRHRINPKKFQMYFGEECVKSTRCDLFAFIFNRSRSECVSALGDSAFSRWLFRFCLNSFSCVCCLAERLRAQTKNINNKILRTALTSNLLQFDSNRRPFNTKTKLKWTKRKSFWFGKFIKWKSNWTNERNERKNKRKKKLIEYSDQTKKIYQTQNNFTHGDILKFLCM